MSSQANYLRYQKKIDKVWDNISRGRFCKAMYRSGKIPRTSVYYRFQRGDHLKWNEKIYEYEEILGMDQHPNDKAFNEALVSQLVFTLHLIPESEPNVPKYEIDLQIKNLLK